MSFPTIRADFVGQNYALNAMPNMQLMVRYLGSSILYTHKDSYKAVAALFTVHFHNPEDMPIRPYYPHRL